MRDDLDKLPLPKSAKKYARLKSSDLGSDWSKKVDTYMDMAADLTNQSKEGFKNKDASGKVKHAFKESEDGLLGELGDVAALPILYDRAMKAVHTAYRHTDDPVTAVGNALAAVGAIGADGKHLRVSSTMSLPDFLTLHIADKNFSAVEKLIRKYAPMASDNAVNVLMRVFQEEYDSIHHMCQPDDLAEAIVSRLLGEDGDDMLSQMGRVANLPQEHYRLAREALNFTFGEGQGMVAAIAAALETVGAVGEDGPIIVKGGETLADLISVYLSDVDTDREVANAVNAIQKLLEQYAGFLEPSAMQALMRIFNEEAQGILDAAETYEQEMDDEMRGDVEESVKAAAVKCHDGTVVAGPPGADHIACCMMANQQGKSWDDEGLGFVTDDDRFLTRDEAEIEGMAHGQLKPDISDPGMVHARDFNWNESFDRGYQYATNCVNCDDVDALNEMMDSAVDVTYNEFVSKVGLPAIFDSGIGYGYYWTPAQAIAGGVDYNEVARNRPLTLKKDWHVSYHRSTYQGKPCYFMVHSAIEYVFVKT